VLSEFETCDVLLGICGRVSDAFPGGKPTWFRLRAAILAAIPPSGFSETGGSSSSGVDVWFSDCLGGTFLRGGSGGTMDIVAFLDD
jgi:hypothetical protein